MEDIRQITEHEADTIAKYVLNKLPLEESLQVVEQVRKDKVLRNYMRIFCSLSGAINILEVSNEKNSGTQE